MAEEQNTQADTSAEKYLDKAGLKTVFGILKSKLNNKANSVDPITSGWMYHVGDVEFSTSDYNYRVTGYRGDVLFEVSADESIHLNRTTYATTITVSDDVLINNVSVKDSLNSIKTLTALPAMIGDIPFTSVTTSFEMAKFIDVDGTVKNSSFASAVVSANLSNSTLVRVDSVMLSTDKTHQFLKGALYDSAGAFIKDLSDSLVTSSSGECKNVIIDCTGASSIKFTTTLMGTQSARVSVGNSLISLIPSKMTEITADDVDAMWDEEN